MMIKRLLIVSLAIASILGTITATGQENKKLERHKAEHALLYQNNLEGNHLESKSIKRHRAEHELLLKSELEHLPLKSKALKRHRAEHEILNRMENSVLTGKILEQHKAERAHLYESRAMRDYNETKLKARERSRKYSAQIRAARHKIEDDVRNQRISESEYKNKMHTIKEAEKALTALNEKIKN